MTMTAYLIVAHKEGCASFATIVFAASQDKAEQHILKRLARIHTDETELVEGKDFQMDDIAFIDQAHELSHTRTAIASNPDLYEDLSFKEYVDQPSVFQLD